MGFMGILVNISLLAIALRRSHYLAKVVAVGAEFATELAAKPYQQTRQLLEYLERLADSRAHRMDPL